ncbi:MAG: tetratricopeptide repeat protein [Planctomycetota bacterium]
MARIYMAYGQYQKAQPLAERALGMAMKNDVPNIELANCLSDLAYIYKGQGRLNGAENLYQMALKLQRKEYYQNHPYIAYTLSNMSSVYRAQGDFESAGRSIDDAIDIMLTCHLPDNRAMVLFYVEKAKVLISENQLSQAEHYYAKAVEIAKSNYGLEHLYTAQVLAGVAELYTLQKRYYEAEDLIEKSLKVQEKIYGLSHPLLTEAWLTGAKIYSARNQDSKAKAFIHKAMSAAQKSGDILAVTRLKQQVSALQQAGKESYPPVAKNNNF